MSMLWSCFQAWFATFDPRAKFFMFLSCSFLRVKNDLPVSPI